MVVCVLASTEAKEGLEIEIEEEGEDDAPLFNKTNDYLKEPKLLDVDEALDLAGGFGRFQVFLLLILVYMSLTIGQHFISAVFLGADPAWTCVKGNTSDFCTQHVGRKISSDSDLFVERCKLKPSEWKYTTKKDFSYVTEFDLVCENTSWAALTSSALYMGGIAGSMFSGVASDAYGRKSVVLATLLLTFLSSTLCSYITRIWQLIVLRAVLGATSVGCFFAGFVLVTEFSTPSFRTTTSTLYIMSLTVSHLTFGLWAYFEPQWRKLQLHNSVPCLLAFCILFYIPESPRMLLGKQKIALAEKVIEKVARMNKKNLDDFDLVCYVNDESAKQYSFIDLFTQWRALLLTVSIGFLWTTNFLVYYSLALEAGSIGGDLYTTFALVTMSDLPSYMLSPCFTTRLGRKKSNLICFVIAGMLVGLLAVIPQSFRWRHIFNISIVMVAKLLVQCSNNEIYTWTSEIFPTVLRSQGISVCVLFSRVGMLVAPFITSMLQRVSYALPFVLMFVLTSIACLLACVLPETRLKPTRETFEEFVGRDENVAKILGSPESSPDGE